MATSFTQRHHLTGTDLSHQLGALFLAWRKHWLQTILWAVGTFLVVSAFSMFWTVIAQGAWQFLTSPALLHTVGGLQFLLMVSGIIFMGSVFLTSAGLLVATPIMLLTYAVMHRRIDAHFESQAYAAWRLFDQGAD